MSIEQAAKYTTDYILESTNKTTILNMEVKALNEKLTGIYSTYAILTTHSDLFIEVTLDASSKEAREVKRDLNKALKCIKDIRIILHGKYAGKEIDKFYFKKEHKHKVGRELGELEYACQEALRHYSPEKGRNPSKEREARIGMLVSLITLFDRIQLPTPSQQDGSFELFIRYIYEILNIYVEHPHQDIKKAKKQLFENNL